jgi:hypothetical protein
MPAETFSSPFENMLKGKCEYEFFDYVNESYSKDKKTRICHITIGNSNEYNCNIVAMVFTIRKQAEKWKIHSEGAMRIDPGATVPLRNASVELAKNMGWKYVAVAITGEAREEETISQYAVSIESFSYGDYTAFDLTESINKLNQLNKPDFYRNIVTVGPNIFSFSFIRKEKFVEYLEVFDNRPYLNSSYDDDEIISEGVPENLSLEELGKILRDMYGDSDSNAIRMFGLKYGDIIQKNGYANAEIVRIAGINQSYDAEVNKGVNIYKSIASNQFGIKFISKCNILPKANSRIRRKHELNRILFGAPGTGKTFSTAKYSIAVVENKQLLDYDKVSRSDLMKKYNYYVFKGTNSLYYFPSKLWL